MAATNKQLLISESCGDSNRCTPYRGKPDQHDTYASHASPRTPSVRFLQVVPVRGNLSQATKSVGRTLLLLRKKGSRHNPQPDWVIRWSATQFLSQHSHWSSNKSQISVDNRLLHLPGPYHWHAIGTFNTCSRVPTPRSLTDTGWANHIDNLRIAISLSPPFPSEGSTDPPNGSAWSQINHNNYQMNWRGKQALNLVSGSFHSTSTITYHLRIAWATDVPQG
jgi:hypothetical protein